MTAIITGSAAYGSTPAFISRKYTPYMASINRLPWAKLMMCSTP